MPADGLRTRITRGWLFGVLLTIFVFWFAGILRQSYSEGESRTKIVGGIVILLASAMSAYQALTNDEYRTSTLTRVSKVLLLLGIVIFVVAGIR